MRDRAGWMTASAGGAGSRKAASNTRRSWRTVGEPKESTMMMVCPLPVIPWLSSAGSW